MRAICETFFLSISYFLLVSSTASALEPAAKEGPWVKKCASFSSEQQFVSESSFYCLRQDNQKVCQQQALEAFNLCGFTGDYAKMSRKMHAKMLVVWAIAGSSPSTDRRTS